MKIIELHAMYGPNYWSDTNSPIIFLKLDLEEFNREPTSQLPGFSASLKSLLPGLQAHKCTTGRHGGFLEVLEQGTWMGHVVEHIALELQNLAGMEVSYGKTSSAKTQGIYNVVFEYRFEKAGLYAAQAAIRMAAALARSEPYDLRGDIEQLRYIASEAALSPGGAFIVNEAEVLGIPWKQVEGTGLVLLGYGNRQRKLRAGVADCTSGVSIEISAQRDEIMKILETACVPVPQGLVIKDENDLKNNIPLLGFPLLIKPATSHYGAGITTGISNEEEALVAYKAARAVAGSGKVIMEQLINGYDYRLLVVNHRLVAAVRCLPASITGDGVSTIEQLLEKMNSNILQVAGSSRSVTGPINSDILERNHLLLHSVLPSGELLILERIFSRQNGGTTEDVTDKVHPSTAQMAERVAALTGLDICAIEIRTRDICREIKSGAGAVVKVDAKPQLELFMEPAEGLSRNIAKPIVDMLFPHGNDGRIPIVAVTGTNGKTTTTRLIAHIAQQAGHTVGFTSTEGIYIGGQQVLEGDCTGPASSQVVLFDPTIDLAVLECARGGILRSGLAFNQCDISIVTNVSADHLGLSEIDTAEEMARVKMVVPRTTKTNGYAILNAEDDLVYAMSDELTCNIALFSMSPGNERLIQHCASGGIAAFVEDGYLTIREGKWKTRIGKIDSIPLTFNSRAESMVKNILPATLAAILQGFSLHTIREALRTFIPGPANTPGRMNIFSFTDFKVMVDYAHNPSGMLGLKKFLAGTDAAVHVGIIGAAGDRRDEDIREIGSISAEIFDEIIIRHDKDLRGRTKEEMTGLLSDGISRVNPDIPLTVVSKEIEAIQFALDHAVKNAFITVCSEKIHETIAFISEQLAKETERPLYTRRDKEILKAQKVIGTDAQHFESKTSD